MRFYELMIELDQHEGSYLAICKHFRAIGGTQLVQDDKEKKLQVCTGWSHGYQETDCSHYRTPLINEIGPNRSDVNDNRNSIMD